MCRYLRCSFQDSTAGLFLSITVVVDTAVTCCLRGARVVWWRRYVHTPATASEDMFTDDGKGGNWRKSCENSSIWCVSLIEGTKVRKKTSLFNHGGLKGIGIEFALYLSPDKGVVSLRCEGDIWTESGCSGRAVYRHQKTSATLCGHDQLGTVRSSLSQTIKSFLRAFRRQNYSTANYRV